jgi:triosephosphate isomerase
MADATRVPIVGGNWKMHGTRSHAQELLHALRAALDGITDVEVVICPPAPWLADAADALADGTLQVGAQNVHWEAEGAFTGAHNASMLAGTVSHVLVGHSERRQIFGETDEQTNLKFKSVIDAGLTPILAVGELEAEREGGDTEAVLRRQLHAAFEGLRALPIGTVIAYEPVWAIGTGRAATPEIAQESAATIRAMVAERFSEATGALIRIQYGGSVNADNASELAVQPDIDGALVGGASLNASEFASICGAFAHAHRLTEA